MKIYLAGTDLIKSYDHDGTILKQKIYILESFHYIKDYKIDNIRNHWNFLLDSGAFTFMNKTKSSKNIDWDDYIRRYAKFIIDNDVKLFFELDIDCVVGLKKVERLRNKLEDLTKTKCIPVWHKSRGLDYWKQICKDYDYIAIGGIVTKEIKSSEHNVFLPLLRIARENNCKVHGLGFTKLELLKRYRFYSVDSTTWTTGNRFGEVHKFNGETLIKTRKPAGHRVRTELTAVNNFKEWVKYQKYADVNL